MSKQLKPVKVQIIRVKYTIRKNDECYKYKHIYVNIIIREVNHKLFLRLLLLALFYWGLNFSWQYEQTADSQVCLGPARLLRRCQLRTVKRTLDKQQIAKFNI